MHTEIEKAKKSLRLLSEKSIDFHLCTAFLANDNALFESDAVQSFLPLYDCLFPHRCKHPKNHLDAERIYLRFADAYALMPTRPTHYETVYYEFMPKEKDALERLSLTLPTFADENDFVIYSPENDTYQYGFYHYGKLREGEPMKICPSGHVLLTKETEKKKRPRLVLAGDALTPFLASYIAHHFDVCMHAPIENARLLAHDLRYFLPDIFLILGGISLLKSTLLLRALSLL